MLTAAKLAALIRIRTGTNSTTYTDANLLVDLGNAQDEICSAIVERNDRYFLIPAKDDLVANQREYAQPDSVLNHIHKVECKFSSSDSRIPLVPVKEYYGSETESEIVKKYANTEGEAYYTIRRRAIFILSGTISSVTDGLRIWYNKYPTALSDLSLTTDLTVDPSTTTFGVPRQFHELWARLVVLEWKGRQPKPKPLNAREQNYANDLETALASIASSDNALEVIGTLPAAEDLWMDGQNL